MSKSNKLISLRNLFILLGSTLSVMQGALITPALTNIAEHFNHIENIVFLSKLLIAIPPIFIAFFSPFTGILFDKFGRKKILILSTILYGLAGSSGYFADNIYIILLGRALLGISIAGLMSGFIVVIGDLFPEKIQMNKFIGYQGALMSFAGVFYLLIGQYLVNISWNLPFLAYLFSIFISIGLLLFLKETKITIKLGEEEIFFAEAKLSNRFYQIHFMAVGIMICYLMIPTQIPFILSELSEGNKQNVGIYISIWILFSSLTSIAYSKIRQYSNYNHSYSIAFLTWSLGFILIYLSFNNFILILGLIFAGIGNGLAIPNIKAQLLDYAGVDQRTKQSGLLTMSLYIGQFLSPIIIEPFIQFFTTKTPFLFFGIILLLGSYHSFIKSRKYSHN